LNFGSIPSLNNITLPGFTNVNGFKIEFQYLNIGGSLAWYCVGFKSNIGYSTTATAAGTTTLDVNSNYNQFFTGSTTQTVVLPVVSTLILGRQFKIRNLSTGIVTINSSGSNLIVALNQFETIILTCIAITGTDASSWDMMRINAGVEYFPFASSDESPALTTGTAKISGHWPYNFTMRGIFIGLSVVSSSGNVTIDMNDKNGTSIFSTRPAIVATEFTSLTNGTQPVISTVSFAKGDIWTIDIDIAGTGAKGLKVYNEGIRY
jgi:hypothetical protein